MDLWTGYRIVHACRGGGLGDVVVESTSAGWEIVMPKLMLIAPPPALEAAIKPEWVERTLIFPQPGGRVISVDGWVYGTLCIHSTWSQFDRNGTAITLPPVTVGHKPTKLALAYLGTVDEAVAAVEWLWDLCPQLWLADEQAVIKAQAPTEALEWSLAHTEGLKR